MLALSVIRDENFLRGRALLLQVIVVDERTFVMPSASRPELATHHRVTFDSADRPTQFSCECEAFGRRKACWAVARALDVFMLLAANNIKLTASGASPVPEATPEPDAEAAGGAASAPKPTGEKFSGRFEQRRKPFKVEPEGNPDALLVARTPGKKVERVRGFQI